MTQLTTNMTSILHMTYKAARRLVVAIIGITVILVGVVLVFTPGPALVVIPLGIAILATEFVWARRLLRRMKDHAQNAYDVVRGRNRGRSERGAAGEDAGDSTTEQPVN